MIAGCCLFLSASGAAQTIVPISADSVVDDESGEELIAREMFFNTRRAGGPGKPIPAGAYEAAVQQLQQTQKDRNVLRSPTAATSWVSVNPTGMFYNRTGANYISGRTNSIAFHPSDANTFYIGAAGGGVWKTTDGGVHFLPMTDNLSALTCGAIAVDPLDPNVVYAATGELNYSLDSYYGDGIFKSTDGGTSWNKIATTSIGSYFSAIVINPVSSNILYAAGQSGIYKSTNAGSTWANVNANSYANSLVMDPGNPLVLYASTGGYNANTIRKTTDGGATWSSLTNGLPASGTSRTSLAISASNPNVLYASIANSTNYGLLGLYRTTDAGASWTLQNSSTNYLGQQGWYDNAVTVNPANSNSVIVGGLDIYSSTDGGVNLVQKTVWFSTSSSNFSHADIHYLGYHGSVLYCGSDGGVYKSANDGTTWSDLNQTISTLQYQSADYDPSNTQRLYGGTQDNDKETSINGGTQWVQRTTGDGGYTVVDPVNTNYIYGQYVNGSLHRSSTFGSSYAEISPSTSTGGLFYNPYEMAPGDHNTIVFARADVWKTSSAQTVTRTSGWTKIATTGTVGGNVSSIGISALTTNKIYIGTSNGRILVTTNNGASWSTTTGYPYVSDFIVDSTNDAVCYATFTGFTASEHVYKTTNNGTAWFSVTGNLPNVPVNSIVLRTTAPRTILVGTDLGVYKSTDDGTSWVSFNSGLPAVEVFDLKYKESTHLLMAATHGRGCYTFNLGAPAQYLLTMQTATYGSACALNPASGSYTTDSCFQISADTCNTGVNNPVYFGSWTGSGPGSYTGTANPATICMNGAITETAHYLSCTYSMSSTKSLFGCAGDTGSINVTATDSCPWHVEVIGLGWVHFDSPDSGFGNGSVFFHTDVTTDTVDRSGPIYLFVGDSSRAQILIVQKSCSTKVNVTLNTSPAGLSVTVDDTAYTSPHTFRWLSGSPHTINTTTPQNVTVDSQEVWASWNDGGLLSHSIIPNSDTSFTANFKTLYHFGAHAVPYDSACTLNPVDGWYRKDTCFQITAGACSTDSTNPVYFDQWTGTGNGSYNGTGNPASVCMGGPITETAHYLPCAYALISPDTLFECNGGSGSISVLAAGTCPWTADNASNAWIHFDSVTTGIGNGTIAFHTDVNADSANRTGAIEIRVGGIFKTQILITEKNCTAQTVKLQTGWNLLSLPLKPVSSIKTMLFPMAVSPAFGYDGQYIKHDTLESGHGYWIKFPDTASVLITGTPILVESLDVKSGWNLMGSTSLSVPVSMIASSPSGIITGKFFRYAKTYQQTDTIDPGSGYWVKVNQDGRLVFFSNSAAPLAQLIRIVPTNELPPPPPNGSASGVGLPTDDVLEQAYPNPFNPKTVIRYQIADASHVTLKIFDVLGREIFGLVDEFQDAGYKSIEWDAEHFASGVYFYKLEATSVTSPGKTFVKVRKMLLAK